MTGLYHSGEKEVQARAGVREMADRIGRSIRSSVPEAAQEFLRRQPLAFFGSIDAGGRVWASVLTGKPGFLLPMNDHTIRIDATPNTGDPLKENLIHSNQVGMLAIEFSARHRIRVNGIAEVREDGCIYLSAHQVYSNCPKYIQAREWEGFGISVPGAPKTTDALSPQQQHFITQADTFLIASSHPEAGADVSHRGGNPGFVRVNDSKNLVWPDYMGNMMFQTLGNIQAHPNAGLLFLNFEKRNTIQITGKAFINWESGSLEQFPGAQRLVEFSIEEIIEIPNVIPLDWKFLGYSPHNPAG